MLLNKIALNIDGCVKVELEGFFIQRFINLCISKGIYLDNTKHLNSSKIVTNVSKNDFKEVCKIAKKTKCKIKIIKKSGVPFYIHRYRKRKIFFSLICVLGILSFLITRFIWNIEINGTEKINKEDLEEILNNNGVCCGKLISGVKIDNLINQIRLQRDDISWVGAQIKGTNFILNIVEAEEKPEIIDETKVNNIISNKKGIISKISVQSGTARVSVGDEIEEGSLLVEGVMEGKYTGIRYVNSQADIYAKITYSKKETAKLIEEEHKLTGNEQNFYKINLNNFKINLNKGVSKFENYDTIYAKKKIRLFSNYYLPIELEKTIYREVKNEEKTYTVEEITNELKTKLENEIIDSLDEKYQEFIESSSNVEVSENNVTISVDCIVEEKIGTKKDLVF